MEAVLATPPEVGPPELDEPVGCLRNFRMLDCEVLELVEQTNKLVAASEIVDKPHLLEVEQTKDGQIIRYGFTTKAGHSYDGVFGMPQRQETDIPLVATSAWLTSSRGHNEHALRHAMRDGEPVIFVGAEGSFRTDSGVRNKEPITLAGSAGATLRFAGAMSDEYANYLDARRRVAVGESRGAMVGMGIVALAGAFDQEVVYADFQAPCFPRKLNIRDALRMTEYAYREPVAFAKMMGHLTFGQAVHYPSTLDLHPHAVSQQPAIGKALFSGEAGELAKLTDPATIAHITVFNADFASMRQDWEAIFANHPNVKITPLDGSHLTLADPETMAFVEARISAFHTLRAQKGDNITGEEIFALAHKILKPIESAA
ncbi:MAG: hypothetical protein ACXWLH_05870 [Candidatus Saccharimonadales bacterium]